MKTLIHAVVSLCLVLFGAVLPAMNAAGVFASSDGADTAAGASIALPDTPSGGFLVLVNRARHAGTLAEWEAFFRDEDEFAVIFEDVSCLIAKGDEGGRELAERYRLQLPENQMKLTEIDATLLASKAENGYIDVCVFSADMAAALGLAPDEEKTAVIRLEDGGDAA